MLGLIVLGVVLRIVFNHVSVVSPFISGVPSLSFWVLGAASFVLSFLCMLLHVWLWGRLSRVTMDLLRNDGRRL